MYKIAVIGDKDSVLAFKILGVDVFITLDAQEIRKTIDRIAKENYGIIFVTEQLAKDIPETIKRYNIYTFIFFYCSLYFRGRNIFLGADHPGFSACP